MSARKIKIRIRKGRFPIFIPAVRISLLKRICRFAAKQYLKHQKHSEYDDRQTLKNIRLLTAYQSIDEMIEDINIFFDEIAGLEPFVLADVQVTEESLSVNIAII
jgi:hypothetical protein